jgi:hypothetical protein
MAYTMEIDPNTGFFVFVEITWDTTPKAGIIIIYTSGCPKNQKIC